MKDIKANRTTIGSFFPVLVPLFVFAHCAQLTYQSGKYIKLSRGETMVGLPPAIGQHNDEIISGLLKYSPEPLQQLREEGLSVNRSAGFR